MNDLTYRIYTFKKIYPLIKKSKKQLFGLCGLKLFFLLINISTPIFYMILINNVMINHQINMLILVATGYIVLYILQTVGTVLNKMIYNRLFINLNLKIRNTILLKYMKMETNDYIKFDYGDLKNRIDDDYKSIEKFINSHCIEYAYSLISAVVIMLILYKTNWELAIFGCIMIPISYLISKITGKKSYIISEEYRAKYGRYEGTLHELLQNWKVIKSDCLEDMMFNKIDKFRKELSSLFFKIHMYWYANRTIIAFKDYFITRILLYFVGGLLVINHNYQIGFLLIFINYYEQLYQNISNITDFMVNLNTDKPSIQRVFAILEHEIIKKSNQKIQNSTIRFKNVSFKYNEDQQLILNKINCVINENEHVAVVGRSGCGKTTFSKLILGVYKPVDGNIEIGGNNIDDLNSDSISRKISVVMQDPVMINTTIRDNLIISKKSAKQQDIEIACKKANILDFIKSLPEKFDTVVGERGVKLSGGEKQRLAIARIILADPDVIIFDEATSALDYENEKIILDFIKAISENKTIISIAHRLTAILDVDRVIVLNEGTIVACGTHEELKGKIEIYDVLFSNQYKSLPQENIE